MINLLRSSILLRFLRDPVTASQSFSLAQWAILIQSARRANLLSRVACLVDKLIGLDALHPKVSFHLSSALTVAQGNQRSVFWEVRKIHQALTEYNIPFVILKGAAYIVGGFEAGLGRLLSDTDIMVPRDRLDETEAAFYKNGWITTKFDAYDQRYYRTWMHELPPMQHLDRGTSLDVHHTILPPTSSLKLDVDKLWRHIQPLKNFSGAYVLGPADMILHSATHLFHDGELENSLRDLVDLDALFRSFMPIEGFWDHLYSRAIELNLSRPLFYAIHYLTKLLDTPVPNDFYQSILQIGAPRESISSIMDFLILRSFASIVFEQKIGLLGPSKFLMYVRSHYLRMPIHLLLPHLFRKQFFFN
jgi:hypothetical protein